ncbi:MAG: cytochrome c oxidase subunit 2, partial [Gammaproteobacteria bacterium]
MKALKHFLFRVLVAALFLLVPILGVWTIFKADDWGLGFPPNVSTVGDAIDGLFFFILWLVTIVFIGTEVVLVWFIFHYSAKRDDKAVYSHGSHKLEMIWTAIPAMILVFVGFSQMGTWNEVKIAFPEDRHAGDHAEDGDVDVEAPAYTRDRPLMEVWGSQFDWRARYTDEEGSLGGIDCVESAFDIYVPADVQVVFRLRTRDVLHSFFVPNFRLKQDAVPGMSIPMWFEVKSDKLDKDADGNPIASSYDLICAELCGWGHYKMSGRIHVLPREEFDT